MAYMQMRLWMLFCVCISTCTVNTAIGQTAGTELRHAAQDAYVRGDYTSAIALYDSVVTQHPRSSAAMYNLANSYLQAGDIGHAILWYERALRIKPQDADILHNLAIARARRIDPVVEIKAFFLQRWLHGISGVLPPVGWGILCLCVIWGLAIGIGLRIYRNGWLPGDKWWLTAGAAVFVIAICLGIFRLREMQRTDEAIVLQTEVVVTSAPDTRSLHIARIGPGEKLHILDALEGFYKVRLANFEQGWILKDTVERI